MTTDLGPTCAHGVAWTHTCMSCGRWRKAPSPAMDASALFCPDCRASTGGHCARHAPAQPAEEVPLATQCPACGTWGDHECRGAANAADPGLTVAYLDLIAELLIENAAGVSRPEAAMTKLTRLRNLRHG